MEVKRISDTEIIVGKARISIIHDNIIYTIAVGSPDEEMARINREQYNILAKKINGKVNYLIDLNKAGKNDPGARKIWQEISEHENTNKVALFGLHPVAKVLASFIIGVNSKKNIRFFHNKETAINWLK